MMKTFLSKIKNNKILNLIIVFSFIFVSVCVLFPAGSFHSSSILESTSEYLSDVAKSHTTSGKYVALMIEPSDSSEKYVNDPYFEFHYLYGIFREGLATYAGTANAEKSHSVKIKELHEESNFSILNVDRGFGVKEYYKDENGNMVYKQEFYPLELMFYSNHPPVPNTLSFLYISKSKADILLDNHGLEHTRENYKSLLNSVITLEIDGVEYNYAIDNIYLEQNYFYEALEEVMGDFLLTGAFYPLGVFKKQALFFLRDYAYQNKFFIEYATSLYSKNDFDFHILKRNFKNDYVLDINKIVFFYDSNNFAAFFLLGVSIVLLLFSLVLILIGPFKFTIRNNIIVAGSLLIPYFIFWLTYILFNNVALFSSFSTTSLIICVIMFSIAYFVIYLYKRDLGYFKG